MLRISKITDYGTLVMTRIAAQPERHFSASELSEGLGLGLPTVSKVLKALARHGLVNSVRGAHGGYNLARAAEAITVAEIIDALEEQPFGLTECSASTGVCERESDCRIRVNWLHINTVVRRALEDVSLADMTEPAPAMRHEHPLRGPESRSKQTVS